MTHPSNDLYGSDRQLLESVAGLVADGWSVSVTVPRAAHAGERPFDEAVRALGAEVLPLDVPVLRKEVLRRPAALARLTADTARTAPLRALVRSVRPDVIYVNTVTAPVWLGVARLTRVPALCHVHEAEEQLPKALRLGLAAPLLLADRVVANSVATADLLARDLPRLRGRTVTVLNGVPGPPAGLPAPPLPEEPPRPLRLVLVGRLSPRKGTDLAVAAVGQLVAEGRDVELDLVGAVFPGYEWFEEELRAAAGRLGSRVRFAGFTADVWSAYGDAHVVLVPSRVEPFGNVAVEAMHMGRPIVATRVGGLAQVVEDGVSGVQVPPDDAAALAAALGALQDDWARTRRLGAGARAAARAFTPERYRRELVSVVAETAGGRPPRP